MGRRKGTGRVASRPGGAAGVNHGCHGWTGVVPANQSHVMASPRVYAVYWDGYFKRTPEAVTLMNQFFTDILGGSYMLQLKQYGVGFGTFAGYSVINPDRRKPPPASLSDTHIQAQLTNWIDNGKVPVKPTLDETNLLYVIFTPNTTNIGPYSGYHESWLYGKPSGDDNLFWAAIQSWHHPTRSSPTPQDFADSCTWSVSHELVESFTDRDGQGFITPHGCEIGDICECAKGCPQIIKASLGKWWVETYWDNQNQSCYPLNVIPQSRILRPAKNRAKRVRRPLARQRDRIRSPLRVQAQ